MNLSFGPWATAVATGANPQLSTFWKTRLAMLSSLKGSSSRMTRRAVFVLECLAVGALAIPTLQWYTESPFGGLTKPALAASVVLLVDDQSSDKSAEAVEPANREPEPVDEYFPRPSAAESKILEALETSVDVEFDQMPLQKCLETLEAQAKIDLWVDKVKLIEEGIALGQPVTLKLQGRKLESILNLLLRPLQCTYFCEDEVLKITTSQAARDKLITRTYPVGDLIGAIGGKGRGAAGKPNEDIAANGNAQPANNDGQTGQQSRTKVLDFTGLVAAISTTIEPDSWEDLSGPGSVSPIRETNSLVVRQTWGMHRKVLQLLRDLRAARHLPPTAPAQPLREPAQESSVEQDSSRSGL